MQSGRKKSAPIPIRPLAFLASALVFSVLVFGQSFPESGASPSFGSINTPRPLKVAAENRTLAGRALAQSQDRYKNGVTNYLEVLEAQEAVVAADENYIASLFSFNVAKISLARALGSAESRVPELLAQLSRRIDFQSEQE